VVTKLLNMAAPDVAYFGQKDAQQLVVIRRLVRDLDIPVRIEAVATVREPDGLALSSRNVRLTPGERERAVALSRALQAAEQAAGGGERDAGAVRRRGGRRDAQPWRRARVPRARRRRHPRTPRDPRGRRPRRRAARLGDTRLIDNTLIHVNGSHPG
jgi:pantoate--beta-alanine ligase